MGNSICSNINVNDDDTELKKNNVINVTNYHRIQNKLEIFKLLKLDDKGFEEIEKIIETITGFKPYKAFKIELNKEKKKIQGTYFQYNKGCILYSLLNNGLIDEQFVPDSMKFYKDHNHKEDDQTQDISWLKRIMSLLDLAQLWMNIGGKCPYSELSIKEIKAKIFLVLKEYFKAPKLDLIKNIFYMTWQNIDYYDLLGDIKVKFFPLMDKIEKNPCIKNGIDKGIIKEGDIIKYGRHCFIFTKKFEENCQIIYSFQDSLSYFFKKDNKKHNNCECDKIKGFVFAHEDSCFINENNTKDYDVGILYVIHE